MAVYGKGGVGKPVRATSVSMSSAQQGRKVLRVGCDPKHDLTIRLLDGDGSITTVLDALRDDPNMTGTVLDPDVDELPLPAPMGEDESMASISG